MVDSVCHDAFHAHPKRSVARCVILVIPNDQEGILEHCFSLTPEHLYTNCARHTCTRVSFIESALEYHFKLR